MNDRINALRNQLEQEIHWVESLNTLLVEEKEILTTRQFNVLEEFATKKNELSNKLEESAQERTLLLNATHQNLTPSLALKELLKKCSAEEAEWIDTLNTKLASLLMRCRELNAVNGQVIANNMYVRQEIVNTLSGKKPDHISVYTSTGTIKSSNDNQHHQEA